MINCGGAIDVKEFFDIDEYTKIYILDSHRPLHLSNLDPKNVHVCVLDEDEHTEKFDLIMNAYDSVMVNKKKIVSRASKIIYPKTISTRMKVNQMIAKKSRWTLCQNEED